MYKMLLLGYKINTMLVVLLVVISIILVSSFSCSMCSSTGIIEGLTKRDKNMEEFTNFDDSAKFNLANYKPIDTSSWEAPDLRLIPGKPPSAGAKRILDRHVQPIPLPEGEMLMFANTPFKPECCPNTYSNSTGCACMTTGQYNHLVSRGGNNVPYSEY
jgi:hypothetical protein